MAVKFVNKAKMIEKSSYLTIFSGILLCLHANAAETPSSLVELQKSIHMARHNPICVYFKRRADDYNENHYAKLMESHKALPDRSSWRFTSFLPNELTRNSSHSPQTLPCLRCFLGPESFHDFTGKKSSSRLRNWLSNLAELRKEQFMESTLSIVSDTVNFNKLTILGFLGPHRHHEVEEMLYTVRAAWPRVPILVVHPTDADAQALAKKHGVTAFPTVLFLETSSTARGNESHVHASLRSHDVALHRMQLILHVYHSPARVITHEKFEHELMIKSKLYVPMLLLLHTASMTSLHYVMAFNRAVLELQDADVHMRFGLLEVNSGTRSVVQQYVTSIVRTTLPHTVLFRSQWKKTTVIGIEQLVIEDRPTPLTVLQAFSKLGLALKSPDGEKIEYEVQIPTQTIEISVPGEGPFGYQCTVYTHNATDNEPYVPPPRPRKVLKKKKQLNIFGTWHERYAAELMDSGLRLEGSIPVVTEHTWSGVVEKSHAPLHPFYPGEKWRGEVTKVALVVFVITDCGSCRRNMPVFEDLNKAVKFVDGGSLYLANCTSDPRLCMDHNVTGFPTLLAFRGLGWLETSDCMPASVPHSDRYVRLDYHGVITEAAVMEWFVRVAGSAVTNSRFSHLHVHDMVEDAHLVGTLVPKHSAYLPRIANQRLDFFYSYACLRLACELLYGQVPCYVQYSTDIPRHEFTDEQQDMVVTQIALHRRDGVWSTVMQLGRTLAQTLHEESASNMYTFHKPHNYELSPQLRCEDDHSTCTGVIVQFALDHSRLPVTRMTTDLFHTQNSLLFYENLPILIAFGYAENLTDNAPFQQSLESVAYAVYTRVVVVAVDVEQYTNWAGLFVPKDYGVQVYDMGEDYSPALYVYPRLCLVEWGDHRHAAFHPPADTQVTIEQPFNFTTEGMLDFVNRYLENPHEMIIETEHF